MIYRFVQHEIPPLEALRDTRIYKVYQKCEDGEKLTRDERDWLFEQFYGSSYGKDRVALHGWMFDWSDKVKRYWVQLKYYGILQYYAIDKTSIRNYFGHQVIKIIEVS